MRAAPWTLIVGLLGYVCVLAHLSRPDFQDLRPDRARLLDWLDEVTTEARPEGWCQFDVAIPAENVDRFVRQSVRDYSAQIVPQLERSMEEFRGKGEFDRALLYQSWIDEIRGGKGKLAEWESLRASLPPDQHFHVRRWHPGPGWHCIPDERTEFVPVGGGATLLLDHW